MKNGQVNLSDNVYFNLKNQILRGELTSGTALREEYLAEVFQVSRTPLRKALTQLMAEGYLVKYKDRTLRIPKISLEELKDTLVARKLLETAAIKETVVKATEGDLERLEHFIWDEEEAMKMHDTLHISSVDKMFHNYLAQASGNKIYEEFIGQLGYKVSLYLALSNTLGDVISEALMEHREILDAVKSRDPERAATAMSAHIDNVEKRILTAINDRSQTEVLPLSSLCQNNNVKDKRK